MSFKNKVILLGLKWLPKIVIITLGIFIIGTIGIIYEGLHLKGSTTFCYAFFAANAIGANCMFSLGRSNVFLEKFNNKIDQNSIYRSGVLFIVAAFIGLIMSAFAYIQIDNSPHNFKNEYWMVIIYITISTWLTIAVILSMAGIITFGLWLRRAFIKYSDDLINKQ